MYTILHNTRCTKSREAIKIMEESGKDFIIREYLKEYLTFEELKEILNILKIKAIDLVRVNEKIWKEEFMDKEFTNDEIIQIMIDNPKLIQRPIVLKNNDGVIGRPVENIQIFLNTK